VAELLLLIAVAMPCLYAYQRTVWQGRLEINHVATFTFGFLFYWITPLAARIFASRLDFPLASVWSSLFREKLIVPYALSCLALYLCFALGDTVGLRLFHDQVTRPAPKVPRLALSVAVAAACVLMAYSGFVFRTALFRPASPTDLNSQAARGAVTACVVVLGMVAIVFTVDRPEIPWRKRLLSVYFLPFLLGMTLMVYLGSRLYAASLLVMFAIYRSNFRARYKLKTVVAGTLIFAFFFGAVGMWREEGSLTGAFFNVFEEPMLGSISLVHHLRYKGISWINYPTQLESDFENLIPTVLLPNKIDVLKKPDAYRPLGGLHSFVSFDLNFGILGSALFWFLWPMGFRYLKSRCSSTLFATMYIMCSGWLTFTFFRDPFSISLVKAIFQYSILIPIALVAFGRLLSLAGSSPNGAAAMLPAQPRMESL